VRERAARIKQHTAQRMVSSPVVVGVCAGTQKDKDRAMDLPR
jgi:hypothetical protein